MDPSTPHADTHTLFVRPPVWALLAAVLLGGLFYITGKYVETRDVPADDPVLISVSGDGKVMAVPDIPEASFGVQTDRLPTAKEAMEALQKRMETITNVVSELGVPEEDLSTEYFSLNPVYEYTTNGRQVLRGYQANQSLRVKIRDLDLLGQVLASAAAAGANQAGGVRFTIDDPEILRAQARAKAIDRAREKAKALAEDLGMDLGELKGFAEGGGGYYPPMPYYDRAMAGSTKAEADAVNAPAIDLPAGQQEIQATVTLTYELE